MMASTDANNCVYFTYDGPALGSKAGNDWLMAEIFCSDFAKRKKDILHFPVVRKACGPCKIFVY